MRFDAYLFLLRLVKAKRTFLPALLSFLFIFSMNSFRSGRGLSATFGSFLFSLVDTESIIAYVRRLGQILVINLAPLRHPVGVMGGNR